MRFSIRDLAWLTLLVAMGLTWWLHAHRSATEKRQLQRDLLCQADLVDQFISVVTQLGCEIPENTGQYIRINVPEKIQRETGCTRFVLTGPYEQLQRNKDGEFDRLRDLP